ncbi:MAG: hypothetical protein PVI57_19405 [Gemmatimonadota bacterium]
MKAFSRDRRHAHFGAIVRALLPTVQIALLVACDNATGPRTAPEGARLQFDGPPHDVIDGSTFHPPVMVRIADASGQPLEDARDPVGLHLATPEGGLTLTGPVTVEPQDGIATFHDVGVSGSATAAELMVEWRDIRATSADFAVVSGPDIIEARLPELAGLEAAYLVDGWAGGRVNDSVFRAASPSIEVGAFRASDARNEVIAFAPGHAPTVVGATWSPAVDTVTVPGRPVAVLPVSVWIVYGPYAEARGRILEDVDAANRLFEIQYAGVRIDPEFFDLTGHPEAASFLDVRGGPRRTGIDELGFTEGRINVYAVRSILDDDDERIIIGRAIIGGDMVLMAELGWGRRTLPHEIGHILGLEHVAGGEGFLQSNLMWPGGNPDRTELTEGQVFRMHYDYRSAAVAVLGLVGLEEARGCRSGVGFHSAGCPREELSLFPDAAPAPANFVSDPVQLYLWWGCGVDAPRRPDVPPVTWRRAFREGPAAGADPEDAALFRARALAAWAASDPDGARPTLQALTDSPDPVLRRTAQRVLDRIVRGAGDFR